MAVLENFGGNLRFEPSEFVVPDDEAAVLRALDRFKGHQIRAVGRLHSWSPVAVARNVALDLRRLNSIRIEAGTDDTAPAIRVGAGCTIDEVLDHLHDHGGWTLPTYSIIGAQSVAGAVATATHGSGRPSLSHFVTKARVAGYGPNGAATIFEWRDGTPLRAARCALGCAGIVLSLTIAIERESLIEESTAWFDRLEEVLAAVDDYPRHQFHLVPWCWRWFAQLRRDSAQRTPSANAAALRILRRLGVDTIWNGSVRLASHFRSRSGPVRWLNRDVFPAMATAGLHVVDHPREVLMMRHDLFRHQQMELFVPAPHIRAASAFVEGGLRWCGGEGGAMTLPLDAGALTAPVLGELESLKGHYVHDYPVTFRRVFRDDALISMTAGPHDIWYAISIVTYQRDRVAFARVARVLAKAMAEAYGARPHWGKLCPLTPGELATLYPSLPAFREHCRLVDPFGAFRTELLDPPDVTSAPTP